MSKEQYKKVLQFCVLSLYTLTAPRRNKDYQEMVVVKNKEKTEDLKYNYLVVDDSEFIFNDYKTSKVEGQKIIKIPKELKDNLNIYFKYKSDSPFLLSDYNGKKLKNINAITYLINDIFDKNVGCSMLRHIYLSNKYGSTLEELKKDSSDMSHSLETQKNYIKI